MSIGDGVRWLGAQALSALRPIPVGPCATEGGGHERPVLAMIRNGRNSVPTSPGISRGKQWIATVVAGVQFAACATVPYVPGKEIEGPRTLALRPGEAQIERGRPSAFLDGLGHYVLSLPTKLLLWNWDVDNHEISPETEARMAKYLADNDLYQVKVRLNEYAPGAEWRRLIHNRAVNGFWRYTIGALSVGLYTILPGRAFAGLFGGDHYNPFTNTVNLYSDHPAIALHEAAHAKDFAQRKYKGTYGALRILPLVPLYQEGLATGDAIGYDRDLGLTDAEKADYKILYPAFTTYIAGEGLRWIGTPWAYPIELAVAIPGHIVGRIKAAGVEDQPATEGVARDARATLSTPEEEAAEGGRSPQESDLLPVAIRH